MASATMTVSLISPEKVLFTGLPGVTTPVAETVESFDALCSGELDHLPEQAFLNVGGAEDAMRKAREFEKNA